MKKKNPAAGRAKISKVPPRPRSRVTRGFKLVDNDDDLCLNTQDLDHCKLAENVNMSERNVEETKNGNDPMIVDDQDDTVIPDTPNSCDVDGDNVKDAALDTDDEVITLKENPKSLNSTSIFNLDTLEMFFETEQGVCIRCNKGDEQVLICNGNGCSTGVHPCCFGFPPTFDDGGNYYCPLCAYKQALSELDEVEKEEALALEKVYMARNSLSLFRSGSNKKVSSSKIHEKELNQSRAGVDSDGCRTTTQFSDVLPKDQPEATATTGCINGNLAKEASLPSERNDIPLSREGDQANQVGSDHRKSTEDLQESVVAAGCSVGNIVVENSRVRKSCDTSLPRGKRLKQVDEFHHLENAENLQEAVAAVRFSNGDSGIVTSLISDRNDASGGGHHAEEVDSHLCESVADLRCKVGPSVSCGNDNACGEDLLLPSEFGNPVTQAKANETKLVEENQQPKEGDKQMQVESSIGSGNRNSPCRETETVSVYSKRITRSTTLQSRVVDPVVKPPSKIILNKKKTASKSDKPASCPSNPALPNPRRKMLCWTHEEEQMLEEAMKVFAGKIGKLTPWVDILKYGSKVFNESRTPEDLKDKWRRKRKKKEKEKEKKERKDDSFAPTSNPALPNPRRKMLCWTHEEEQMLEEAMKVFAGKIGKLTPWVDILEYGSKVFHESRTPEDLKDKWRRKGKPKEKGKERKERKDDSFAPT